MNKEKFPYEVIEEYVRGGCSVIYKIKALQGDEEEKDETEYVLKTMSVQDNDPQSVQRFYMEYEFLRAYPHLNLIQVKDYFHDWHGRPAYVMEWVEGNTWQSYWQERPALEEPRMFLHIFKQLGEVIDYIHKHQIIHRDLKPQNILISQADVLKLIDFGIMKVADLTLYTHRNTFMGSAYYVAPEGISGEQVTNTADIFSLGVMLYDLFTGMKPFQGHTLGETIYQRLAKKPQPPSQIADVPKELDTIILKMMERDPNKRQPNCAVVFESLEKVFGRFEPINVTEQPVIDILTKGPFLHAPFIDAAEGYLREQHGLYICGPEGSGKTTIVENLNARLHTDTVLRLDCRQNSTDMEFIEVILRHLNIPTAVNRDLARWKEILADALPGLLWPRPSISQAVNPAGIMTAFQQVMKAVTKTSILVIEDLQDAPNAVLNFIQRLAGLITSKANPNLYLVVTSDKPVPAFSAFGRPFTVNFPDVLSLNEYTSGQFGGSRIPVELTEQLSEMAGHNVGRFIRMVQGFKDAGRLAIQDGVLTLADAPVNGTPSADQDFSTVPFELSQFSPDEVKHLEWLALCPDGIDMNLLRTVTRTDLSTLGITVDKAGLANLLEFQSSVTEGFRWKNEDVKRYLVNSISTEEKLKRFLILAQSIETESSQFLPYSPPLWLILSRLYQQAGNDDKAGEYALNYARHCAQTANYEPVRNLLSRFIPLPLFQDNQEFWCLLSLAYRDEDTGQALYFATKALKIRENPQVLSLLAALEFAAGKPERARNCVHKLFTGDAAKQLELQYVGHLMPILVNLGEQASAALLMEDLETKLKGRDDHSSSNMLLSARLHYFQAAPSEILALAADIKGQLLPHTQEELNQFICQAQRDRFQYHQAVETLKKMDLDPKTDPDYYRQWLLLYLVFRRINDIKTLCSSWERRSAENNELKQLKPLFQIVTGLLVNDPNIYQLDHLKQQLTEARLHQSIWPAEFAAMMDFWLAEPELIRYLIEIIEESAPPPGKHHLHRLRLILQLKENDFSYLVEKLSEAVSHCKAHDLITERLRLFALCDFVRRREWADPEIDFGFEEELLTSGSAQHFLSQLYPFEKGAVD